MRSLIDLVIKAKGDRKLTIGIAIISAVIVIDMIIAITS